MKPWYYFGCGKGPGHYLFGEGMSTVSREARKTNRALELMDRGVFDGLLAPRIEPIKLYQATYSILPGLGFVAVAWHDQSEDKRSGSNSTIFAPIDAMDGLPPTYEDVISQGAVRFPYVFTRLPHALTRWVPEH